MASTSAKVAKDKGNASFKAGNFADAVGHYSAAIVADRTDPTYPLNRAAAYLKLGKHNDAERDCTICLTLDGKNVKALFRRAQARIALQNLTEAEKDLSDALRLDPVNHSIKQELTALKQRKTEAAKRELSSKRDPITVSPVPSSSQSKAEREALPLKRTTRNVPIEIVEGDEPPPVIEHNASVDFLKPVQSRVLSPPVTESNASADFLKPVQSRVLSPPSTSRSVGDSSPSTSISPLPVSQVKPRVGAAIFHADGKHTIIRDPASSSTAATPVPSSPAPPPRSPSPAHPSSPTSSPPLTHFAFSRAWYALSTAYERYTLLRRIPPESLPAFFKTSLEPALLMSIIHALSDVSSSTTNAVIAEYMDAFTAVSRFATVVLFLSAEEKAVVRRVWEALGDGHDAGRRAWGV